MKNRVAVALLVAALAPAARAEAPTPESVIGFAPGTDRKLADFGQIHEYFRRLDAASDRLKLVEFGRSEEGRPLLVAFISSERNLKALDRHRDVARQLALGRGLDEKRARALAEEGRAIVWLDNGLHATEVAPSQHAPELAYKVIADDSAAMREVRENVILALVPCINPDGLEKVAAWYRKNLGTPFEVAPMVELYQLYAGHDNNRDWYMFNLAESRAVARQLYHELHPQLVYNQHQTAPFPARIFVPPFADPMNPNIPPLVVRGIQEAGTAIAARLERQGKPGVLSRQAFDAWWNGGLRTAPYFHNQIGILTETALWRYATPRTYDPAKLPKSFRDGTPTQTPTMFHPLPWTGGAWRLRDAMDYVREASLAVLELAAERRFEWLFGRWQMARDQIAAGERGGPFAYVIPAAQRDPGAARRLVEALRTGGVEVAVAKAAFRAGEREYAAGAYVVPMAQAFRAFAKDLLEPQKYPARAGAQPYDITGWTLPLQMGVDGAFAAAPFEAALEPLAALEPPAGAFGAGISGEGGALIVDAASPVAHLVARRALAGGARVSRFEAAVEAGGRTFVPGAFAIEGGDRDALAALAAARGAAGVAVAAPPGGSRRTLAVKRIGLLKPWTASMDEGWTRFLLERLEVPFTSVRDEDVRAGGLLAKFDALVVPDMARNTLLHGHRAGAVPPEYAGGLGLEGALELRRFVEQGGTLVALDSAGEFALELFPLPLRNVVAGVARSEYAAPGSLLRVRFDAAHPLAWGLAPETAVFVEGGPVLDALVDDDDEPGAEAAAPRPVFVGRFADKDVLASGFLQGESRIAGKGALVEVPFGRGRVVLTGFRPQFRAQSWAAYNTLLNALW
ncbi:MAG: peptidase M14 [Vicinamibacteria bacterium]|nr:peptidase M14 [Vicinamibacteria bacterium]